MSLHTTREAKALTFLLTTLAVGCLSFSVTKLFTVMKFQVSSAVCLGVGLFFLVFDILDLSLED